MNKPTIKLTRTNNRAVNTRTAESCDQLLRVLELDGRIWRSSRAKATYFRGDRVLEDHGRNTCINLGERDLNYSDKEFYEKNGFNVVTPQEFYESQDPPITQETLQQINSWFDRE